MRRLSVRLPDPAHERLEQHAHQSGLPLASAATHLLRALLEDDNAAPASGLRAPQARPSRTPATRPSAPQTDSTGPPWLPSDADPHWPEHTWHAILALHRRYPDALAKLEQDWHERPERVEVLSALATWRASIDAAAEDPREELSFHNALQQLSRTLDRVSLVGKQFDAGAPMPPSWPQHL